MRTSWAKLQSRQDRSGPGRKAYKAENWTYAKAICRFRSKPLPKRDDRAHQNGMSRPSYWTCSEIVESFPDLKGERAWRTVLYTSDQAENAIARYIDAFYNAVRRHSALDFLSPIQFEKRAAS